MTTLENFKILDNKVTELENNLEYTTDTYVPEMIVTKEYTETLIQSQKLYNELVEQGINPFDER